MVMHIMDYDYCAAAVGKGHVIKQGYLYKQAQDALQGVTRCTSEKLQAESYTLHATSQAAGYAARGCRHRM